MLASKGELDLVPWLYEGTFILAPCGAGDLPSLTGFLFSPFKYSIAVVAGCGAYPINYHPIGPPGSATRQRHSRSQRSYDDLECVTLIHYSPQLVRGRSG